MNTAIIVVIIVVILVIGAALFVFLPRGGQGYARRMDKRLRDENTITDPEPLERPERPRPPMRMKTAGAPLMPMIITIVRAVIGLAAVAVLAFIFTSTSDAATAATDAGIKTSLYAEGIFKTVVTIGIASGLYLFTRSNR